MSNYLLLRKCLPSMTDVTATYSSKHILSNTTSLTTGGSNIHTHDLTYDLECYGYDNYHDSAISSTTYYPKSICFRLCKLVYAVDIITNNLLFSGDILLSDTNICPIGYTKKESNYFLTITNDKTKLGTLEYNNIHSHGDVYNNGISDATHVSAGAYLPPPATDYPPYVTFTVCVKD